MRRRAALAVLLTALLLTLVHAQGLLSPIPADLNGSHPLAWRLVNWWIALPPLMGGEQWWPFVGRFPGTLTNMGAGSGWAGAGRQGWTGAMQFDGVDDAIVISTSTDFDFLDQTFTVAFRFRSVNGTATTYFLSKKNSIGTAGWFVRLGSGAMRARLYNVNGSEAASRTTVANTTLGGGAWYSAVVVFTTDTVTEASNDVSIYINGVYDASARTTDAEGPYYPCPECPLTLGTLSDQVSGFLSGALDDIRFWKRGLSAAEAMAYHRSLPPTFDGLLAPPDLLQVMTTPTAPPAAPVKRRVTIQ
jgi:hypothetical protein